MTASDPTNDLHENVSSNQRFLDAALDLFLEHGYHGTSLQMIGDRLGVSKAAVTYHFPSKDELLRAVSGPAFDEMESLLRDAEGIKRETARRKAALEGYIDYLIRFRRVAAWLTRDVAALANPVVLEPAMALSGRIDRLFVAGADDTVAHIWGAALTQALSGPFVTGVAASDEELREQLSEIGVVMMRGFRATRRNLKEASLASATVGS
jgi:AcrR family transcriptional regulator